MHKLEYELFTPQIIKRTGEIVVPRFTFTVTHTHKVTVSNSATIDAVPEFLI